ncbi:SDR family oxidoreductase [Thermogemmatispora tikiterensis]|uniref:Epimerase n=1 Tax=Thermogemmatispora tikiterensis TaxID=1825093 RepID=A0A328VDJ8_9CHLR|nr:NAD(P)H-binding protein [Thermogemmatispora tikiterensis]RAQ95647.1 epimerase [Thermogemmatispora tikiterensis]
MTLGNEINVVTGAFSYTGQYIARRLLARGKEVRTLTGHPQRAHPLSNQVQAFPLAFDDPRLLREALRGARVLYNTYWIRFPYGQQSYERAVENTRRLFTAAREAGIERIVHVSISNPSLSSPFPYFRGKALLEQDLRQSGLSYAIVRPTVIFGREDILINNIAWLLRHFPLFALFGNGDYQLQPVYVEDMADLAVRVGHQQEDVIVDAAGPDIFSYREMVALIARILERRVWLVPAPPALVLALGQLLSLFVGDVLITRDEIDGLMANLLVSHEAPTGQTHLADWLQAHVTEVGRRYASELARHYR